MTTDLDELLRRGALDDLVRAVDHHAGRGDWATVGWLRERCQHAAEELGHQLWGVAQFAAYRTALEAPGHLAATVVTPGAARFALGPLTEVVAQHHTFDEVADHLDEVVAGPVADERVIRGEDLTGDPRVPHGRSGVPAVLQPWEPSYATPTYRADDRLDSSPTVRPGPASTSHDPPGRPHDLGVVERALWQVAAPWAERSSGEVHVAVVAGDAASAAAALLPGPVSLAAVTLAEAFALLGAAAASGGTHGPRRGAAAGRTGAWWVGHAVSGVPLGADPDELEFELEDRRWYVFTDADAPGPRPGSDLRLAVEDPDGWAAAIDAHDPPSRNTQDENPDEEADRVGV